MPLADGPAGEDAGRVEVRSGADGSLLFAVDGEAPHAALGTSVAPARDVTGDGLADVIVGAPRTFPATAPGYALLLAGPAGALIQRFDGDTDQDRFGSAVSGLGDADGDGVRDVVVSAPGWFPSTAYVESGATGATLATATHPDAAFTIATSLAPLGDVDGDARPDFVWGLPAVDVFNSGYVSVVSGASGAILKDPRRAELLRRARRRGGRRRLRWRRHAPTSPSSRGTSTATRAACGSRRAPRASRSCTS
jgi:hypothetical protein